MPKNRTPVVIAVILAVALVGFSVHLHITYVRDLEAVHYANYSNWVNSYLFAVHDLDRGVAVALMATNEQMLEHALEQAHEAAQRLRSYLSDFYIHSTTTPLRTMSSWVSGDIHGLSYLTYLNTKRELPVLSLTERENLLLIRQRTEVVQNAVLIAERALLSPSRLTGKNMPTSWNRLRRDPTVIAVMHRLGEKLRELPYVGQNDASYQMAVAQEHNRLRRDSFAKGLIGSGKQIFSEDAMRAKAEEFLKTMTKGPLTYEGLAGSSSSDGVGAAYSFLFADRQTGNQYAIEVTEVSGHISAVTLFKGRTRPTLRDAQAMGQDALSKWQTFEGTTLVPLEESDFRYAYKSRNVIAPNKSVGISFGSADDDFVFRIYAHSFFAYYLTPTTHTPTLSPEEAIALLHPTLRATGLPSLVDREGTLVYAIPVSGVERVQVIYINALTGQYEGMRYHSH